MNRSLTRGLLVSALALACFAPATASDAVAPSTAVAPTVTVALQPPAAVPSTWHRAFRLPYGSAREKVATSPGGDAGTTRWGPDFGVQMPGGTWWVVDTAKARLAHFSAKGGFLGAVTVPKRLLRRGIYFPWSHPRALADGRVVLSAPGEHSTALLVLDHGRLSRVAVGRVFSPHADDGRFLYGFDGAGHEVRVNPRTGAVRQVAGFRGQDGAMYALRVSGDRITAKRWTAAGTTYSRVLRVRSAGHPADEVHPAIEVAVGVDGTLALLITGIIERTPGELSEVDGYLTISRAGVVSAVERMRRPWSPSDPGTGGHLGIRPGTSTPWLMFVDPDGVRVFTRTAS